MFVRWMVVRQRGRRSRHAVEHPGMTESLPAEVASTPNSPAPTSTGLSRRNLLLAGAGAGAVGVTGGLALAGPAFGSGPALWVQPDHAGAPEVHGLHLQFGADAAREAVVSWFTPQSVEAPHAVIGTAAGGFGRQVPARTITYT